MLWTRKKYDILKKKGTWNAPTEEEEKIISLEAQVRKMENKFKSIKKPTEKSSKSPHKEYDIQTMKKKPHWFFTKTKDPKKKVM